MGIPSGWAALDTSTLFAPSRRRRGGLRRPAPLRWSGAAAACALLLLLLPGVAPPALAQFKDVTVGIDPTKIGLGGRIYRGLPTPIFISLDYRGTELRNVVCRLELPDADGEPQIEERTVTLNPSRVQPVWLYAWPRQVSEDVTDYNKEAWRIQVVDKDTGLVLDSQVITPFQSNQPDEDKELRHTRTVAILGTGIRGLEPYTRNVTQFESMRLITGLDARDLPDRWYGLAQAQAIIWTPSGPDPGSSQLTPEAADALHEWVRRGGHLVVSLPSLANPWPGSPLKDLLPPMGTTVQHGVRPPGCLGVPTTADVIPIDLTTFQPLGDQTVLLRDDSGDPLVVAWQYGFGRVTVVGIDLSDRGLVQMDLPSGGTFWAKVFGWNGPPYSQQYVDGELNATPPRFRSADFRSNAEVDTRLIGPWISMTDRATNQLLLAVAFFLGYWLLAGPVGFGILKSKGWVRHAWLAFVAVLGVCSVIAWGGATLLRQRHTSIEHFTVMDIDGATGLVHAHSWLSLFSPAHGRVDVKIDPARPQDIITHNTIACPGLPGGNGAPFIDPEHYTIDATMPDHVTLPFRATAKQLEIDFLGNLLSDESYVTAHWGLPHGKLRLIDGELVGTITHDLPGTLEDVLIVYSPGDGKTPWVTRVGQWAPGKDLQIVPAATTIKTDEALKVHMPAGARALLQPPNDSHPDDPWRGFLGELTNKLRPGFEGAQHLDVVGGRASADVTIEYIWELTFFSMLPPPLYAVDPKEKDAPIYGVQRSTGRQLDLTALMGLRRVIIIGHLKSGPFPIPMSVDGSPVTADGTWTTVRWISPIEQ